MRILSKPTTSNCNIEMYTSYLISEPNHISCTRLSTIVGQEASHDSINRFLAREEFTPKDLFNEVYGEIILEGGTLSCDDMVIDKPYRNPKLTELVSYFWSGKHKKAVKGINLITLYYTDDNGVQVPVNYRVYDKNDNKSKNDYMQDMIREVINWGLFPKFITGDSWYSGLNNLKFIKKYKLNFCFGISSNRLVSIEYGKFIQVQNLKHWNEDGEIVYLKDYGQVKIYKQEFKEGSRYYILGLSNESYLQSLLKVDFERIRKEHWNIETFHRAIKQLCGIEKFFVRQTRCIMTHIYSSLISFVKLEFLKTKRKIDTWYQIKRDLFVDVIRKFILGKTMQNLIA